MLHIGQNIVLIRKLAGKTQKEFILFFTGVSISMLKSYEGKRANPSELFIQELADLSGVSEQDLMNKPLKKSDINFQVEKVQKDEINGLGTTLYEKASIIVIKQILAKMMAQSDQFDKVQVCLNEIEGRTNAEMQRLLKQLRKTVS